MQNSLNRATMPRREGFTLIELMIVIVIIGLLAVVAMPFLWKTKDRALIATMRNDLKTLATQQEIYFGRNLTYANAAGLITEYQASPGIVVTVTYAQTDGWAATAQHNSVAGQCGLFIGNAQASDAPPATSAGVTACN